MGTAEKVLGNWVIAVGSGRRSDVVELDDQQRRLKVTDAGGDPRSAVRVVFSWFYRHLPAGAARTLRLLGRHDDRAALRRSVRELLAATGLSLFATVADGTAALSAVGNGCPDGALVDVQPARG